MPLVDIDELPARKDVAPGWDGRFLHTQNLTFAAWKVVAGTKLPAHSHPNEQVTIVLSGEFEFTIGGEVALARRGQLAVVASNVEHSGRAVTDCHLMDVFYPVRKEYQSG